MNEGGGLQNPHEPKAIARHELLCKLEDVISASAYLLKNKGRFYLVHRPQRLVDIIYLLRKYRLEPKNSFCTALWRQRTKFTFNWSYKNAGVLIKVLAPHVYMMKMENILLN